MNEFIIEASLPPPFIPRGKPKSELRTQLETLQPGQVLRWRPTLAHRALKAYEIAGGLGKARGWKFTVRKENGGYDIYRTA